jgi:hypothetical protein
MGLQMDLHRKRHSSQIGKVSCIMWYFRKAGRLKRRRKDPAKKTGRWGCLRPLLTRCRPRFDCHVASVVERV